jgi:hypothetical protein
MAYTVKPDGSIEVGSLEEAIALSRRLSERKPSVGDVALAVEKTRGSASRAATTTPSQPALRGWDMFLAHLNENQVRLLGVIQHEGRMALSEIAAALGFTDNRSVTGVLSGLYKNAKKHELDFVEVLERDEVGDVVFYLPGETLRRAHPILPAAPSAQKPGGATGGNGA